MTMDIKSLIASASADIYKEQPYTRSSLKGAYMKNGKLEVGSNYGKQDALEAVKLDPAVLEAQVTVHTKNEKAKNRQDVIYNNKVKDSQSTLPSGKSFEDMVSQHEAALLSLTPHQLELLIKYVDVLRRQRMTTQRYLECAFCKNNGKPLYWYTSHALKDIRGRVRCPVLRQYRCQRCGATGDYAHTIKYCPENSHIDSRSSCSGNSLF